MFHKLDEVEAHFQDIEVRLTSPDVVTNQNLFQKLSKEHSNLQPLVHTYREYRKLRADYSANEALIREDSGESETRERDYVEQLSIADHGFGRFCGERRDDQPFGGGKRSRSNRHAADELGPFDQHRHTLAVWLGT